MEVFSALRGVINSDSLLTLWQCITVYASYPVIYKPWGEITEWGLIILIRYVNLQADKTILESMFFLVRQVLGSSIVWNIHAFWYVYLEREENERWCWLNSLLFCVY